MNEAEEKNEREKKGSRKPVRKGDEKEKTKLKERRREKLVGEQRKSRGRSSSTKAHISLN